MIKKGLNPYKNNDLQIEKKLSVDDDNKQIIVKDESDKYLKELLENKNEKKEKIIVKNRNKEDIDYLIIEDDDDGLDIVSAIAYRNHLGMFKEGLTNITSILFQFQNL